MTSSNTVSREENRVVEPRLLQLVRHGSSSTSNDDEVSISVGDHLHSIKFSNYRRNRFERLRTALSQMSSFDEKHPLFVEGELAGRAQLVLDTIENNSDVEPPQLYPFEDDTLVLKWSAALMDRFLSVVGSEVEVTTEESSSSSAKTVEFGERWQESLRGLFESIGANFSSSSGA